MVLAFLALGVALLLTLGGPALLRGLGRGRLLSPRGMLAVWSLAPAVWLLTWTTLVLALVSQVLGPGLKGIVTACVTLMQAVHRNGAELGILLVLGTGGVGLSRLLWVAFRHAREAVRWRRSHLRELASCARPRIIHRQRVWLLETDRPGAYCVPGNRFGIVVTRGALDTLTPGQLRAVLAHERAHLRGRHHFLVAWVRLLDEAFPRVPLLSAAVEEVDVLVEWAADDRAARSVGANPLAHALGALAVSGSTDRTAPALAASGACTVQRVRRLLAAPPARHSRIRRFAFTGAALTTLLAPPALLLAATMASVAVARCSCAV